LKASLLLFLDFIYELLKDFLILSFVIYPLFYTSASIFFGKVLEIFNDFFDDYKFVED
jgi:hypothetical protein